jgi:hypothetical protein
VKIEAHLVAKHALRARARAVGLGHALADHVLHEIFVLAADGAHKGLLDENNFAPSLSGEPILL